MVLCNKIDASRTLEILRTQGPSVENILNKQKIAGNKLTPNSFLARQF